MLIWQSLFFAKTSLKGGENMAKNEAKVRFSAETSGFNESIKKSNDAMQRLRAEFRLNEEQMRTTGTTVEGLEAKHRNLTSQLTNAQQKTQALNQKLQTAIEIFGENSTEVNRLRTQLANAQIAEEKIKQAISNCNDELEAQRAAASRTESVTDRLTDTISDQRKELDRLKAEYVDAVLQYGDTSDEARQLESAISSLSGELRQNQNTLSNASDRADELERSLDDVEESADEAEGGFTIMKGALANLVSSGIQAAISGIGNLASSFFNLVDETKEYRTIMASLDNSSKLAGYSANETSKTFTQLNGVLGDTQSAATTTANLQAIGLEQGKLQSLTNGVIGAWAKYGDSIPIDGLGEAVNHTVKLGEVQGTLADVLEWGGITVDDFNAQLEKCNSETERADLIAKMLADQGLTEAGKAWQETNKDIVDTNNAQAEYEENTATLAQRVSPVVNSIKEGFNGVFKEALNLTKNTDFEGLGNTIKEAFGNFTKDILPKVVEGIKDFVKGISDAYKWLQKNKAVIAAVAGVMGILATAITAYNVVQTVKLAMDAAEVTTVWALVKAQLAHAAAAIAAVAPYVLVVAAIAAVIAIIVLCVKYWDEIVIAVKAAWEKIKEALSTVGEWINTNVIQPVVNFFKSLWESIVNVFKSIVDWVKNNWKSIVAFMINPLAGVFSYLYSNFEGFRNFIDGIVNSVKQFFVNLWNDIKAIWDGICNAIQVAIMFIGSIISAAVNIITLPFRFIWENCKEYVFAAWEWIKNNVTTAINAIKSVISTVMNAIKSVITTVWNAIKKTISTVVNAIKNVVTTVFNAVKSKVTSIFNAVKTFVTTVWNAIKNAITKVLYAIKTVINTVFNAVKSKVTSIFNAVKSFVTSVWNSIKSVITSVVNAIKNTVTSVFNAVKSKVTSIFNSIKSTASSIWNGIKTSISNAATKAKNTVSNIWNSLKTVTSNAFNSVKSTATRIFNNVKTAITKPIQAAKDKVKSIVESIKSLFNKMKLSFPKIKMPHFKITGKFSLDPPSVPKLGVEFYKDGGILTRPTIFGMNGNKAMVGGEAGAEAILPIDKLEGYIENVIDKSMQVVNLQSLAYAIEDLANRPVELNINGRQFALATASDGDNVNGLRNSFRSRGLVLE